MKPLSLNLSSMKKIASDKNSSTFMHPSGHRMVIAHSALSSLQRKQIDKLPVHHFDVGGTALNSSDNNLVAEPVDQISPDAQSPNAPLDIEKVDEPAPPKAASPELNNSSVDQPAAPTEEPIGRSLTEQESSLNQEKKAYQDQAAGAGSNLTPELNKVQADIAKLPTQKDLLDSYQLKNDQLLRAYQNQKVDPDRFMNDKGLGGKIAAGIGIILGGLGGKGNGNVALDVINKRIDNDIKAQQNNQDKALNLYKINQRAYGNAAEALNATKEQMLTGLKYKIQVAAANATSLAQKTNAQVAAAKIDQEIGQLHYQRSLMNPTKGNIDPATVVPALIPPGPEREKAYSEIEAAQNTAQNAGKILNAFDEAAKESRPLTGGFNGTSVSAFNPLSQTPNQGAYHALLGPTFKDVEGTVRQAAMDNMYKNTTPAFGDSDYKIQTKRTALQGYLDSKRSAPVAKAHGIDLSKYPSTTYSHVPVNPLEGKTASDANGNKIIMKNGSWVPYGR